MSARAKAVLRVANQCLQRRVGEPIDIENPAWFAELRTEIKGECSDLLRVFHGWNERDLDMMLEIVFELATVNARTGGVYRLTGERV